MEVLISQISNICEDIKELKRSIPIIAKDKAEETIARTAFIKPIEKITVGISLFFVVAMAFSSYGKLTSIMDRFERLDQKLEATNVIESSTWVKDNKINISNGLTELDKQIESLKYRIKLLENRTGL